MAFSSILGSLIRELLKLLPKDFIKEAIDAMLDKIEEKIQASDNKYDDACILPLIKLIRDSFDIPDND